MNERVRNIINTWDPCYLFPMAPIDEYEREIELIEKILNTDAKLKEEELAIKIHRIFIDRFGKDVYLKNFDDCINVAIKILQIYKCS